MPTTYIIKPPRTRNRSLVRTTDVFTARYRHRVRDTGRRLRGGGLTFRMVEADGVDEQTLELRLDRESYRPDGQRAGGTWITVARSQDAVDKSVRRLRAEDLTALAEIDAEITDLRDQIKAARVRRADRLHESWPRATKVPLREIVALVP